MNTIRSIQRLNEEELRLGITGKASWHADYEHSAYVHVGGLLYEMNEGDIVSVFSQCGEIIDCNLVRDPETGESKGFAFIGYTDQRSTILAVDNFNATKICGRTIKVDHVNDYRVPKEFRENNDEVLEYKPTGPDGSGWGEFKRLTEDRLTEHQEKVLDAEGQWERQLMKEFRKGNAKDKKHKSKKHKVHKGHKEQKEHKEHKHKSSRKHEKNKKSPRSRSFSPIERRS